MTCRHKLSLIDAATGECAACDAERATVSALEAAQARVKELETFAQKVNYIRNSIVGMQGFNFSEHAYPLVAALEEIGVKGDGHKLAAKNLGTLIDQIKAAEARIAELEAEREGLVRRTVEACAKKVIALGPEYDDATVDDAVDAIREVDVSTILGESPRTVAVPVEVLREVLEAVRKSEEWIPYSQGYAESDGRRLTAALAKLPKEE